MENQPVEYGHLGHLLLYTIPSTAVISPIVYECNHGCTFQSGAKETVEREEYTLLSCVHDFRIVLM